MTDLNAYVNFEAKGDMVKLLSSGFSISTGTASPVLLGAVKNFKVAHGKNSGEVKLSFTRITGALSYNYYYTPTPASIDSWKMESGSTTRFSFTGLQRGVEYTIRIAAVGSNGQMVYSDSLTILVV